jgi:hypothetical protein
MGSNMTVKVPFFPVISKQLRILGSFRYGMGDYPLAISLVERGLIDLKPLVTQVVEFEDALEAFETTRKGRDVNGKVSFIFLTLWWGADECSPLSSVSSMLPSRRLYESIESDMDIIVKNHSTSVVSLSNAYLAS